MRTSEAGVGSTVVDSPDDLVERARKGDHSALPPLRRLLDQDPALLERWPELSRLARLAWTAVAFREDLGAREAALRRLAQLEDELAGPDAAPLERLLAERIALARFLSGHADALAAKLIAEGRHEGAAAKLVLSMQAAADKRMLAAVRAMSLHRALLGRSRTGEPARPRLAEGTTPTAASA